MIDIATIIIISILTFYLGILLGTYVTYRIAKKHFTDVDK